MDILIRYSFFEPLGVKGLNHDTEISRVSNGGPAIIEVVTFEVATKFLNELV